MDKSTAYSLLGLNQDATVEDVKAAYKALSQQYSAGDADLSTEKLQEKMNELNQAFDIVMSFLRTGSESSTSQPEYTASSSAGSYSDIRQMINSGKTDQALAELGAIPGEKRDAEWNFLMGSAYYYKGWLDQAIFYFQAAVRLEPGNREYQAALRNLQSSSEGNMPGNPSGGEPNPGGLALNCACNTCTMMCCMDACCSMCRGF